MSFWRRLSRETGKRWRAKKEGVAGEGIFARPPVLGQWVRAVEDGT